jgi:hypothetical protein
MIIYFSHMSVYTGVKGGDKGGVKGGDSGNEDGADELDRVDVIDSPEVHIHVPTCMCIWIYVNAFMHT